VAQQVKHRHCKREFRRQWWSSGSVKPAHWFVNSSNCLPHSTTWQYIWHTVL